MEADKIAVGSFEIYGLRDGFFHLDGGTMFGVVPKILWEKIYLADQKNRIKLGLNSLLIKNQASLVLIETGIGTLLDQKFYEYYSVERKPGLLSALKNLDVSAEEIDFVVNSHLHFDHCGGNTYKNQEKEIVPVFPNAKYIIQKGEWDYALKPSCRDKPSYLSVCFLPLKKFGNLQLVEGNTQISEGLEVILTPGHTAHHQCVKLYSDRQTLFFLGDMVPTSAHVNLPYIMSYDLFPLETLMNKERFLEQAVDEDWIVAFNHDPAYFFGKIRKKKKKYIFEPLQKKS